MTTITIKGGIYLNPEAYGDSDKYKFFGGKFESWDVYVAVVEHVITVKLPAGFDQRSAQVQALEKKKQEITAAFSAAVPELNARISKLTAITNEVPA